MVVGASDRIEGAPLALDRLAIDVLGACGERAAQPVVNTGTLYQ